jgi:hypothetical protein
VTERETRTTDRAETTRPLIEQFQLLGDGIDALLSRLSGRPSATAA